MLATWGGGIPGGFVLPGASADLFFSANAYFPGPVTTLISTSRASTGYAQWIDGHWSSFGNNLPRITDQGLLVEEARTNLFLNSQAPVTQTVTVVSSSVYTVSVYGNASVVLTGATTGTVTQASGPKTFTAGSTSLVCTVSGAGGTFQNVQVELGGFATSPIVTAGSTVTRAADVITLQGAALTAALNAKAARFVTNSNAGGNNPTFLQSSVSPFQAMRSTGATFANINNGSQNASATLGSGTFAGLVKSAFGFDTTSITAIANGGTKAISANSFGTFAGPLYVGSNGGSIAFFNGALLRATFGPTKGMFDAMTTGSNPT